MNHPVALVATLVFALAAPPTAAQTDPAVAVVREYSTAVSRADCPTVFARLSPSLKARYSNQQVLQAEICRFLEALHAEGTSETIQQPIASLSEGEYRLVVIPFRRIGRIDAANNLAVATQAQYWVHSSDAGRTWYVLDIGCMGPKWANEVFPPYNGFPPAVPASGELVRLEQ